MLRVRVLSGPSLDRLGLREPELYGRTTLDEVHARLALVARELGVEVECSQSSHEGQLVDWVWDARERGFRGLLVNAGAYTHTSVALYDALRGAGLPAVEVHLTSPEAREPFRRRSRIAAACVAKVAGFGALSYELALRGLVDLLRRA